MDDTPERPAETFSLFQFSLSAGVEEGGTAQKSLCWGDGFTIEEAFNAARSLVLRDLEAMRAVLDEEGRPEEDAGLVVTDTEFGYDLRHRGVIVSRYWIHPKPAVRPPA